MLTEVFASTILTASLTGAGIVLAVFGIILPIIHYLAEFRAKEISSSKENFLREAKKVHKASNINDVEKVSDSLLNLKQKLQTPDFLGKMPLGSFVLYMFSALLTYYWLAETSAASSTTWVEPTIKIFLL